MVKVCALVVAGEGETVPPVVAGDRETVPSVVAGDGVVSVALTTSQD